MLINFREKGWEREREKHWWKRETSISCLLIYTLTRDQTHNLGMCLTMNGTYDLLIYGTTLQSTDHTGQSSHLDFEITINWCDCPGTCFNMPVWVEHQNQPFSVKIILEKMQVTMVKDHCTKFNFFYHSTLPQRILGKSLTILQKHMAFCTLCQAELPNFIYFWWQVKISWRPFRISHWDVKILSWRR